MRPLITTRAPNPEISHEKMNNLIKKKKSRLISRPDLKSAKVLETGISLQDMVGTAAAAGYLKSESIAMDVAARVLSQPAKRRRVLEKTP